MRVLYSSKTKIRHEIFTEIARMAYEGGDCSRLGELPYKIVPGEIASYRESIFLERAGVGERLRVAMGLSLRLGIICTIVCLVLSYPLAMILNNRKIKNQGLVVFIFMLPMWMNFMLRILAWKLLLSKNGVINSILTGFGLSRINIINTPTAVVLGMVYDFLPFMLLPIYNSMTRIRKDWIEAARDLGAGNVTIFLKIILPLTVSGIISGIVMVFVPSLTSFAISLVLGGGHVLLIGNVIEQDFMQGMQWNAGSGLSFVLMIFVIASMTIVNIFDKEGEGTSIC